MKPRPTSFAITIHFNPVTECNILNISHSLPVTFCNITDITPATNRNIMNMLPATICNKTELKRTKPPLMTELINYKPLKMNTTPQPKNTIFKRHQKSATKRNKTELWRTNSKVPTWGADSYRYRGPIATDKKNLEHGIKTEQYKEKVPCKGI